MADLLKKWEPVEGFKARFTGPRSDQNRTPRTCEIPQRRRDRWEQSPKKLRLSTPRVKRNRQRLGEYCLDLRHRERLERHGVDDPGPEGGAGSVGSDVSRPVVGSPLSRSTSIIA